MELNSSPYARVNQTITGDESNFEAFVGKISGKHDITGQYINLIIRISAGHELLVQSNSVARIIAVLFLAYRSKLFSIIFKDELKRTNVFALGNSAANVKGNVSICINVSRTYGDGNIFILSRSYYREASQHGYAQNNCK